MTTDSKKIGPPTNNSAQLGGKSYACPCCGFLTLLERGGFEICPICFWEDTGQDDADAELLRGGPNGKLTLAQARKNFKAFGACDEGHKNNIRSPEPDEIS